MGKSICLSSTTIAPAVRMVAMSVWVDGLGQCWHRLFPVVGIVSRRMRDYDHSSKYPETGYTHKELIRLGWTVEEDYIEHSFIYVEYDGVHSYITDTFSQRFSDGVNVIHCDWPASEDEERLKEEIQYMKEAAMKSYEEEQLKQQLAVAGETK